MISARRGTTAHLSRQRRKDCIVLPLSAQYAVDFSPTISSPLKSKGFPLDNKKPLETIDPSFGIVLKQLRENKGLSQEELADMCGRDRTYISLLERARRNPTLPTMLRLCAALGISLRALAGSIEREQGRKK